jgi:predicted ATPase
MSESDEFVDEPDMFAARFVRAVELKEEIPSRKYPFNIPAIRAIRRLPLHPEVTFLIGDNGSGKSTLIEALAVLADFNPEGGTKNQNFATRATESILHNHLRLQRGIKRERDGYFLRAEGMYNVATNLEELGISADWYGGIPLHDRSHGEAFLAVMTHRFRGNGLYLLDEPESALSPARQRALLKRILHLAGNKNSQFIISTHSPVLLAYPGAIIYYLHDNGIERIDYHDTEVYRTMRDFTSNPEIYLHHLLGDLRL